MMKIKSVYQTEFWRKTGHKFWLTLLLLSAAGLLSACSFLKMFVDSSPLKQIQIIAEINANQNTATAIDIVFVYDDNAVSLLPKTSPEWFEKKAALMLSLANNIEVVSLQMPPATLANVDLPAKHSKAVGVYSFINYLDVSGQAVGNLTPYKIMSIWLAPTSVLYKGK